MSLASLYVDIEAIANVDSEMMPTQQVDTTHGMGLIVSGSYK